VVLNPGVYPHRAYLDLANLVVTFEGNLEMHRGVQVPLWATALPPQRFCHLVYGAHRQLALEASEQNVSLNRLAAARPTGA
ncbi:MAG TPA: hypothetical protein VIJ15_11060, partial [Dermatophilaceae bacterium]